MARSDSCASSAGNVIDRSCRARTILRHCAAQPEHPPRGGSDSVVASVSDRSNARPTGNRPRPLSGLLTLAARMFSMRLPDAAAQRCANAFPPVAVGNHQPRERQPQHPRRREAHCLGWETRGCDVGKSPVTHCHCALRRPRHGRRRAASVARPRQLARAGEHRAARIDQRGRVVEPIRCRSTARAHCLPSRIAQTTSDCPRRMSPAANTLSALVL